MPKSSNKPKAVADNKNNQDGEFGGLIGISSKFAVLNRLITRDLNNNTNTPIFTLYSKDDIATYLSNPYKYEKQLRKAVIYMYGASSHFRRLVQYFVGLSDLSYVVSPYNIDPQSINPKTVNRNYRKVLKTLSAMNVRTQCPQIIDVCVREDVFYGTLWITSDNITIQRLPSDYCSISTIEGNVLNVSFDFSYFDSRGQLLEYYPVEFQKKYTQYQSDRRNRWIELDAPTSFAIKCNNDILDYALPPFAGILRDVYDLEDYKQLKKTKTSLENYAMLDMRLPINEDGEWGMDLDKAKEFWRNLDAVLPEEVGSVLSPMELNKISFERSHSSEANTISEAEQNLYSAAGTQSLLFNNEKASANSLILSIKVDQALTYGIVKSIEDAINRYIQSQPYGKNFRVTFLDCSPFNRKEVGEAYLKAASYGMPTISYYCASQGLGQAELDNMSFLETTVLGLQDIFKPLQSSSQMSSKDLDSKAATDEGGAPQKEIGEISESGEVNRENE